MKDSHGEEIEDYLKIQDDYRQMDRLDPIIQIAACIIMLILLAIALIALLLN